jgi:hypothetical protein
MLNNYKKPIILKDNSSTSNNKKYYQKVDKVENIKEDIKVDIKEDIEDKPLNENVIQDKEKKKDKNIEKMDITNNLDEDEKLLFSLQIIGSLQKNEKLTEKNGLPSVDDRYFQLFTRWYSGDSRHVTSDKVFELSKNTYNRINVLLDEDHKAKILEIEKNNSEKKPEKIESPEEKNFREECEDRRRLIKKYYITLSKTKQGIENLRDTYYDQFTKEKLSLALAKVDEIINKLSIL